MVSAGRGPIVFSLPLCFLFLPSFMGLEMSVANFSSFFLFFLSGTRFLVVFYFLSVSWLAKELRVTQERLLSLELRL